MEYGDTSKKGNTVLLVVRGMRLTVQLEGPEQGLDIADPSEAKVFRPTHHHRINARTSCVFSVENHE